MDSTYEVKVTRVTLPVNVAGIVRDVEFVIRHNADGVVLGQGQSEFIFTAKVGRGAKTHNAHATLVVDQTFEQLRRLGYNVNHGTLVERDGQFYGIKLTTTVLNRQARITGWRQDAVATSRHIME